MDLYWYKRTLLILAILKLIYFHCLSQNVYLYIRRCLQFKCWIIYIILKVEKCSKLVGIKSDHFWIGRAWENQAGGETWPCLRISSNFRKQLFKYIEMKCQKKFLWNISLLTYNGQFKSWSRRRHFFPSIFLHWKPC